VKLKEVLKLPGILGAAKFTPKGELESYKGEISEDDARMAAHMCASNSVVMQMQARLFAEYSQQPEWNSYQGWVMMGPEMGVMVVGDTLCIVNSQQASINDLMAALSS
jgi:roadblock/LC7 domain-containing protein